MLTIGDLVTVDQQAEFRNDVQLDAFDKPQQNLGLLRSYLFSSATPQGKTAGLRSTSSVDLMNEVVEAFLNSRLENRLVAIANYGHGKKRPGAGIGELLQPPRRLPRSTDRVGQARESGQRSERERHVSGISRRAGANPGQFDYAATCHAASKSNSFPASNVRCPSTHATLGRGNAVLASAGGESA